MYRVNYKDYPITFGVIVACIVIYIWTSLQYSPEMSALEGISAGGYLPLLVRTEHEYYRLISANFIHFGIAHILMNMLSLYNIGPFIERIFGQRRYILLVLGSCLGTTLIPYIYYLLFSSPTSAMGLTVSGGASGLI